MSTIKHVILQKTTIFCTKQNGKPKVKLNMNNDSISRAQKWM